MTHERILIVDDEAPIVEMCSRILTRHGYTVEGTTSGREAIARLESGGRPGGSSYHLLLVDIKMEDVDGPTVLRRGRELDPHLAAVVITGYGTLDSAIEALHAGAQRFVLKPFESRDLLQAVEDALAQRRKEQERLRLQAQLPILEIGQALMAGDQVEFLSGRLLEVVTQQVGADRAVLLLPDGVEGGWQVAGLVGGGTEGQEEIGLSLWQDLLGEGSVSDAVLATEGEVAVALRSGTKTVGLLGLSRSEGDLTPSERDLLLIVARQIAAALENADLYREIRDSRDYFRTVLDSLHDEVMVVDRDLLVTDVNTTFLDNMGYERGEVIGKPCHQVSHECDVACSGLEHPCPVDDVWRTGRPARRLHIHQDKGGKTKYVNVIASPLRGRDGEVAGVVEAFRDVTAEWQLEGSLATVRELGRELVLSRDKMEIARLVVSAAERILDFERCGLWLVDEEERVLQMWVSTDETRAAALPPLPLEGDLGITVAVARSGRAIYLPDTGKDPRYLGGNLDSRSELCVPLIVKGQVLGVLNAESPKLDAFDEADRRLFDTLADQAALALENARLYQAVAQAEREWVETFDAITDGISIHDAEFRIVRANRTLAEWLGVPAEALVGQTCYTLLHQTTEPPDFCPLAEVLTGERPHTIEIEEPVLGGMFQISAYPLSDTLGKMVGGVHIVQDISGRKQMERQLIQSEKLAATGRLAASLAHEINNPLQAIHNGLQILLTFSVEPEEQRDYLEITDQEVERLIEMVGRILDFARRPELRMEPTDLGQVVRTVLALSNKYLQHRDVVLVEDLDPNLPRVLAAPDGLKQVFLNLVVNAVESMPGGGTLCVTGRRQEGGKVVIAFADTGNGIPAKHLEHIFEPFYSTKDGSSGLGLSVSHNVIEEHGGRLVAESEVGRGTTMTVWLPVLDNAGEVADAPGR